MLERNAATISIMVREKVNKNVCNVTPVVWWSGVVVVKQTFLISVTGSSSATEGLDHQTEDSQENSWLNFGKVTSW